MSDSKKVQVVVVTSSSITFHWMTTDQTPEEVYDDIYVTMRHRYRIPERYISNVSHKYAGPTAAICFDSSEGLYGGVFLFDMMVKAANRV
jgi:hypothetical protein